MTNYRSFAIASAERAVKAFCATLLAFLPANGLDAVPDLNWGDMLTLSGYAALASVLFSVVSSQIGGTGPSLANEVISPPAVDPEEGHADLTTVLIALACAIVVVTVYAVVL